MFSDLPQDILKDILLLYLRIDTHDLSRLDCALTNHRFRSEWLTLLPTLTIAPKDIATVQSGICELEQYVLWLSSRRVSVTQLFVGPSRLAITYSLCSNLQLPAVESITFVDNCYYDYYLPTFVSWLPNLTAVHAERWTTLTDRGLRALLPVRPLRSLMLLGCRDLSAEAVLDALTHCGDVLEEFSCSVLTDRAAVTIPTICRKLRHLTLDVDRIADPESILLLCSSNALLTHLQLSDNRSRSKLIDTMLPDIIRHCPCLEKIVVHSVTFLAFRVGLLLHRIVDACPAIREVIVNEVHCVANKDKNWGIVAGV